ncbi:hypothetical protein HanRHA438_Chr09g0412681 [Helianthus annuus]|uniref:Uncharacterized protein n=1 Tax=Helianthus annuus TaxID=4232 RepID=A0A251RQM8_HELAN|nr:hypothetical protein HanXRQr2_Chr09g0400831 [Helianthus annuus]KAF5791978.1 hypothetical protein HanXRQr2_Chr09g0400841 [Helianthus annuus]KAJ0535548.1 hypothetical protein HanIR_Chr09g0431791 [Helianthus annuus]KAJ0889423.1 hypothetical protein HanRHA438_Chr09g0412681 [Helianthus annuus]KAJ0894225.1 hypothetical protein HanPSC8_Chr09g0386631 [Helianthus annuus]
MVIVLVRHLSHNPTFSLSFVTSIAGENHNSPEKTTEVRWNSRHPLLCRITITFVLLDYSPFLTRTFLQESTTQSMLIDQDSRKQARMALETHFRN